MMKYIAHVTWEDIDTECHSANHCPAAAAIQRATGFGWSFVDKRHIFLYNDQVQRMGSVKTPGPVVKFIRHYDDQRDGLLRTLKRWFYVRPFSFEFEVEL